MKNETFINKGGLVRTFSVCDPSIKRKRLIVNLALLDLFFLNGVLLSVGLFLVPSMLWIFMAMMPIISAATITQHLLLKSVLMKGAYPVTLYSNGFEFHSFLFNRVLRRPDFIRREDVASISVSSFSEGPRADEMRDLLTIYFETKSGRINNTGTRNRVEVESAIEWIERNWGLKVERKNSYSPSPPQTAAHVAHKVNVHTIYCPQCGKGNDQGFNFCPFCGANFELKSAPSEPQGGQWTAPSTPSYNPYQRAPSETYQAPLPVNAPLNYPGGKDRRKAFFLGLGLGFMGFMGVGHIYMGKKAKGVTLLIVGGFLAFFSLMFWIVALDLTEYSLGVRVFTALLMSAPYLALQIWQAFDAPKPPKENGRGRY
ncbi:MAG: zinc ribbon domain-containing protein [Methanomassiliicoccales archaeon]|nr:zinc ribbon domain-containing protein [Methanomassiliicoccales archaeon]